MPTEEFDYNGRHVVITNENFETSVTINGVPIPFSYSSQTRTYVPINHSSFRTYNSLLEMIHEVADKYFRPLGG